MVLEMHAMVQSVHILIDLTKASYSVRNTNEIATAVSDVLAKLTMAQAAVLASQESEAALTKRVGKLEKEIMELKNWDHEKERYVLTQTTASGFVYSVKPGMEQGEPPHLLCANCFTQNQKSILQASVQQHGVYDCPRCKTRIRVDSPKPSSGGIVPTPRERNAY